MQNLDTGGAGAFRGDGLLRLALVGLAASSGAMGRLHSIAKIEWPCHCSSIDVCAHQAITATTILMKLSACAFLELVLEELHSGALLTHKQQLKS